jgi:hypothetical protein
VLDGNGSLEREEVMLTLFSTSGLPDGLFSNRKNPDLGKFWRALEWKMLFYLENIWNI